MPQQDNRPAPTGASVGKSADVALPETTEAVREAAWLVIGVLEYGQLSWTDLVDEVAWSESTLRRASQVLQLVGAIAFDRKTGMWSRVEDVEVPAALWPRRALLEEQERSRASLLKGLRLVHDEYLKEKQHEPEAWSAPAFARAMQLICESVGLPLDRAAWGEPS